MNLADYIARNKGRLIERWKELAVERLALPLESSQLLNDLPDFIDDLVAALRNPTEQWPALEGAKRHGRHRMRTGIDMGSLTEEMTLIIECVCELAGQDQLGLSPGDMRRLTRVVGRGTATSVRAYMALRDEEFARESARHFSFVAHELRTPLQGARMAASLLDAELGPRRNKYRERLERSLSRLTDLIDNALVQVRLSGAPDMNVQRIDVGEILEMACDDVVDHVETRGLTLQADVAHFEIDGDRKLLHSALSNLLKNAVKFTRPAGRIAVRASVRGDRAVFEVEDECGGMPEDLPGRLFEPFIQAHEDTSGFGLGLMIVKQAVEAHGGSVHVVNRPHQGCSFVVDLPLRQSQSPVTNAG